MRAVAAVILLISMTASSGWMFHPSTEVIPVSEESFFYKVRPARGYGGALGCIRNGYTDEPRDSYNWVTPAGTITNALPARIQMVSVQTNQVLAVMGKELIRLNYPTLRKEILFSAPEQIDSASECSGHILLSFWSSAKKTAEIVALNYDGKLAWRTELKTNEWLNVIGEWAFAARSPEWSAQGVELSRLDPKDGTRIWKQRFPHLSPHPHGEDLWFGDDRGLKRYSGRDGKLVRSYPFKGAGVSPVFRSTGETLFVSVTTGYDYGERLKLEPRTLHPTAAIATNRLYKLENNDFKFLSEVKMNFQTMTPLDENRLILSSWSETALFEIPTSQIVWRKAGTLKARLGATLFCVEGDPTKLWRYDLATGHPN